MKLEHFSLSLQAPMRALLSALGSPQADLPVAHIAGTKGKGSVVAMLHCILREAGYKVGTYTRYDADAFRRKMGCTCRSKLCFLLPASLLDCCVCPAARTCSRCMSESASMESRSRARTLTRSCPAGWQLLGRL